MRKLNVSEIRKIISELCIKANIILRKDVEKAIKNAFKKEKNKKAKNIFKILLENAKIAKKEKRPLCQDTGLVCVYLKVGQDVMLVGGDLKMAINKGVEEGYRKGYLRKSVVKSPVMRKNTGTNTPAIVYTDIVKGNKVKITVVPKGFGSENKSKIAMMNPTASDKDIVSFIVSVVREAGPDACPPYILGVGLGGTFDKASSLAKESLILPIDKINKDLHLKRLEKDILDKVNKLNIGPIGLGGATCLGVNILEYPTHIAGLPVAVNISCHITRSASKTI